MCDWQRLIRRNVTQVRQIVRKLLVGRIVSTRKAAGGYDFTGQGTLERVLARHSFPQSIGVRRGFSSSSVPRSVVRYLAATPTGSPFANARKAAGNSFR
jgi:hypothetical protein